MLSNNCDKTNKNKIYEKCIKYFDYYYWNYDNNLTQTFIKIINEIGINPEDVDIFAKYIKFKKEAYKQIISCKEFSNIVMSLSKYDKKLKQLGIIMKNINLEKEYYIPFYFIDSIKSIKTIKDLKIRLKTIKHQINHYHIKYAIKLFVDKKIISYLIKKYNISYISNIKKIYDIDLIFKCYFDVLYKNHDDYAWYYKLHINEYKSIGEICKNEIIMTFLKKIPNDMKSLLKKIIKNKLFITDEIYNIFKLNVVHDYSLLKLALQYNNYIVYQKCCENSNILLTNDNLHFLIRCNLNNFGSPLYGDSPCNANDIILKSMCTNYKLSIDVNILCDILDYKIKGSNYCLDIINNMILDYGLIPNKRLYSILILRNKKQFSYDIDYDEELFFLIFNTNDLSLVYNKIKYLKWNIPNIKHRLECIRLSNLSSKNKLVKYIQDNYNEMDRYCTSCLLKFTYVNVNDILNTYNIGKEYLFLKFASITFKSTCTTVITDIITEHNIRIDWKYMLNKPNIKHYYLKRF